MRINMWVKQQLIKMYPVLKGQLSTKMSIRETNRILHREVKTDLYVSWDLNANLDRTLVIAQYDY